MYIFSIVGPWLLIGALLSSKSQQVLLSFLKGTLTGLYWFIPWMILRILLPQVFTLGLTVSNIFQSYLLFHTLVPFVILISTSLKHLKMNDIYYLIGSLASFFIFSGYLNIFLFPVHGPYSAAFLIPITTILLISGLFFGFSRLKSTDLFLYSRETLSIDRSKLLNNGFLLVQLGLMCFINAYLFVLDFQRMPGLLVSWLVLNFFLLLSIYVTPELINKLERYVLIPWIDNKLIPKLSYAKSKLVGNFSKKNK